MIVKVKTYYYVHMGKRQEDSLAEHNQKSIGKGRPGSRHALTVPKNRPETLFRMH